MRSKQFIFNIVINKLNLNDERVTDIKNLIVKFKFDDIQFNITKSRINVTDFGEGRSVEFSSTLDDLRTKLKEIPFELTILQSKPFEESSDKALFKPGTEKRDSEKSISSKSESEKSGSVPIVGNTENDGSNLGIQEKEADIEESSHISKITIIGEASCSWPDSLLSKLNDNCTSTIPHVQVCDIRQSGKIVGNISLGIMLHCKCDAEFPTEHNTSQGFLNEEGIQRTFQNIQTEIDKNDVFFVIGREPEHRSEDFPSKLISELSPQLSISKFGPRLDTSRYKLLRGTLVKDCSVFDKDKCRDFENNRFDRYKPQHKVRSKRQDKNNSSKCCCCCCELFGDHRKHGEKSSSSESSNKLDSGEESNTEMKGNRPLVTKSRPLTSRFCPKCCQNLTFTAIHSPCPKCGYKLPDKRIHTSNETADDILRQWDSDTETFPNNQLSRKVDCCTCKEQTDSAENPRKCLYCRIQQICIEVNDCDPQCSRQHESRTDSDTENPKGKKICYEIIEKYGNDCDHDEKDKQELWKGQFKRPHLSKALNGKVKNLRVLAIGADVKSTCFPKRPKSINRLPKRDRNKNCEGGQYTKLSPEERIRKIVDKLCETSETVPKKTKPRTVKKLFDKMQRESRHRYCYPKRMSKILDGHDRCVPDKSHVPPSMGWLWNRDEVALKKGWRPGTINRSVRELMSYFLADFPVDTLPTTQETAALTRPPLQPVPEEELIQKPTLRIQKQSGQFLITMHPLISEKELAVNANPYAKVDPIQFKIVKDPMALKRRLIKRYLKLIGFKKCDCGQSVYRCICRTYREKLRLLDSLRDICGVLQVSNQNESLYLSDTTESESHLDMEFTPPAGIVKPYLRRKPDIAEISTQYDEKDYNCFIGQRNSVQHDVMGKTRQYCPGPIVSEPCQLKDRPRNKKRRHKLSDNLKAGESSENRDKVADRPNRSVNKNGKR